MNYEPKTWACGDTITADDLNHIEQGVAEAGGGAPFVVTFSQLEFGGAVTADKTYAEVNEAFQQGKVVRGILNRGNGMLVYSLEMMGESGVIQGFCIKPYIENGTVSKFEIKTAGIMPDGTAFVGDYEKQ